MSNEKKEKRLLLVSFWAGLAFAVAELAFAVYSHSHSSLMDAVYDSTELIFIGLVLFLTPLFHLPISEKHPYGYYQLESIFLIIKGFMMLAVTMSVSVNVIESVFSGGNPVDNVLVSLFQMILCVVCFIVFVIMKRLNRSVSSPTVDAEILEWKLDIGYSLGISLAFFFSIFLKDTPLAGITPYVDQVVTVLIMLFMLPEIIRMLRDAIRDLFLFSPDEETVQEIKSICETLLEKYEFRSVFYDITRTGRRMWISVYFDINGKLLATEKLKQAVNEINRTMNEHFENCTCELIPASQDEVESVLMTQL